MTRKIVQFGAPWCASCKAIRPFVEGLATEMGVPFEYVDLDKDPDAGERFAVRGLPTVLMMKDGIEAGRVAVASQTQIRTVARGALF